MIKISNFLNTLRYRADTKLCNIFTIVFLFPTFWGYLSIGEGQMLYLLITAFLSYFLMIGRCVRFPHIAWIFLSQIIAYSITLSLNMKDGVITLKDYTDIIRPLFYLYFFSIPLIVGFTKYSLTKVLKNIVLLSIAIVVVDLFKFVGGFDAIIKLYALWERDSLNYYRFAGTFCYCYNYGFIIIFCILWLLYSKIKHYKILVCLFSLILLATGSRSVYLASFISILLFFFTSKKSVVYKISLSLIFVLGLVMFYNFIKMYEIPYLSSSISYVENLVLALQGQSNDGSLATRTMQLDRVVVTWMQNPLIGRGPLKEISAPIEIQLGYYLSSWGLLGTAIFLISMLVFCVLAYKTNKCGVSHVANFSKANLLWLVSAFIVGMSTPITDQVRVFQIFYLIQGMQYVLYRSVCRQC